MAIKTKKDLKDFSLDVGKKFDAQDEPTKKRLERVLKHIETQIVGYAKDLSRGMKPSKGLTPDFKDMQKQSSKATAAKQAIAIRTQIAEYFREYYGEAQKIVGGYEKSAGTILSQFGKTGIPEDFSTVDKDVISALQQVSYSQFEDLGKTFQNRIADEMYRSVLTGRDFGTMVKSIRAALTGLEDVRGRPMTKYASTIAHDQYMKFNRAFTTSKAEDLDIKYFLYVGSIITDSREFCVERAGKLFSLKEIQSWETMDWQGKDPTQSVMVALGGYNCRHHLQPVPTFLAVKLYPDQVDEEDLEAVTGVGKEGEKAAEQEEAAAEILETLPTAKEEVPEEPFEPVAEPMEEMTREGVPEEKPELPAAEIQQAQSSFEESTVEGSKEIKEEAQEQVEREGKTLSETRVPDESLIDKVLHTTSDPKSWMEPRAKTIIGMAKRSGKTPEEVEAEILKEVERLVEPADVFTRVTPASLEGILKDGRFRTQYETRRHRGGLLMEKRKAVEDILFDEKGIPDEERPIYGYLSQDSTGSHDVITHYPKEGIPEKYRMIDSYGKIRVKFKKKIKEERTTFNEGDSYDIIGKMIAKKEHLISEGMSKEQIESIEKTSPEKLVDAIPPILPSAVSDPKSVSFHATSLEKLRSSKTIDDVTSNYIEAQIHGGVKVEDIEEVIFQDEKTEKKFKAKLKKLGIKTSVKKDY